MNFSNAISISCNPEELWAWLTEPEKIRSWNPEILEQETISAGEVGPGFRSRVLMKEGKKSVWYEEEILEFKPSTTLKMKLSGGSLGKGPMIMTYRLSDEGDKTKLSYANTWEPKGVILKLLHGIITKVAKKNVEGSLNKLKTEIENGNN